MAGTVVEEFKERWPERKPDWRNLARHVERRRRALNLTQEQIAAKPTGPSTATMRLIEGAAQDNYRSRTLTNLEILLRWPPDAHLWALAGENPYLAMTATEFWDGLYAPPPDAVELLRARYGSRPATSSEGTPAPAVALPLTDEQWVHRLDRPDVPPRVRKAILAVLAARNREEQALTDLFDALAEEG